MEIKEMMKFSELHPGDLFEIVGINEVYLKLDEDFAHSDNDIELFGNAVTLSGIRDVVHAADLVYKLNGKIVIG